MYLYLQNAFLLRDTNRIYLLRILKNAESINYHELYLCKLADHNHFNSLYLVIYLVATCLISTLMLSICCYHLYTVLCYRVLHSLILSYLFTIILLLIFFDIHALVVMLPLSSNSILFPPYLHFMSFWKSISSRSLVKSESTVSANL